MKRTSAWRKRVETTPARAEGDSEKEVERYAGAFARVRLVRTWIAVVVGVVAMLSAYVALLERVERWWSSLPGRRAPRRTAVLAMSYLLGVLALLVPGPVNATPVRGSDMPSRSMPSVSLSHDGNGTASVNTNASSSTTFTLTNISTGTLTVNLVATVCNGSLLSGSCSPSPTSVNLASGAATTISVSFSGSASPGTGTLTLAAQNTSGSTLASSSVTVTVNAAPTGPTVSTSPHRGDMRDVSQCIADCFESTFSYATPAYISLDVPRSVTLLYRSGRAKPMGRLSLDVSDANTAVTSFRLQLADPNGSYITFTNGATSLFFAKNGSGATRIAAEFDASLIPTSAKQYTAYVTSFASGVAGVTGSVSVRIIIINDGASPFGAGVDVVGLQRLFTSQSGGVLVTDGSGSASFFSGSCSPLVTCTFTSPGGDFSTLTTGSGLYNRTYPDGTSVTFDNVGRQLSTKSRFEDSTTVTWGTNATSVSVPTRFTDPVGQTIELGFQGVNPPYQTGSLAWLLVQGARDAHFGVLSSGNLEHLIDVDGQWYGVAGYDSQHRLSWYRDKAADTTLYAYAYGKTISYVDAPPITVEGVSGTVRPRVQYREQWSGFYQQATAGGGTAWSSPIPVPTFDVRAAITDARGNATFLSLNRFGTADTVKAPLSGPAVAQYDTLTGQLLRSVSPTGGITRLTWVGDQLRQTIDSGGQKTVNIDYASKYSLPKHIHGDVQEESFAYDTIKTGWPLLTSRVGSSTATPTTYQFDTYGRPTSISDPSAHTVSYAYQTSGLRNRSSVISPSGDTTKFGYDGWGRIVSTSDPYGRVSATALDVLNRPGWITNPANDTTKFQYDALNNVTVLTDPKGQVYTTQRNALGWLITQTDPGSRVDSIKYDSAGRVVYLRTRAERRIRLQYDSLSRVTKKLGLTSGDSVKYVYDPQSRWVIDSVFSGSTLVSADSIVTDSVGRTIRELTIRPGVGSWRVSSGFNPTDPGRASAVLVKTSVTPPTVEAQVDFTYDANKRLSTIQVPYGNSIFGYDVEDFPWTVTFQSGLVDTRTQTKSHAESRRSYSLSTVDTVLKRWYRTDSLSRIVERGGAGPLYQKFSYDSADRIRTWTKWARTGAPSCTNNGATATAALARSTARSRACR